MLGDRLRALRESRGLSQGALAQKVGVSQGMISHIERGRRRPSLPTLMRLIQALEAPQREVLQWFSEEFLPWLSKEDVRR
ncbi:hypothetical protein CSW25_07120 [Thermus scotoductus]|uniref:HTH cro/C1-type domain-containing protein n=1 Tax=Thermus scotoductus TaxID=37636 RepID=A0A430S2K0_THESC|nr:MAG: helix-turn-helix domain-containing protein [Thermus antranikianii]RTG98123.1 hypothetical protein CSW49_01615 [Thermus scotoductus]RTH02833.1 hypothetical protein CSW50_06590 [Thermus scotoductus]RTH06663.1 hypothetical protein CSW45_01495 [Thermus scotoductus]RTH12670.1 hypothetical protein CSW46_01555 [Thermus scotoductus]